MRLYAELHCHTTYSDGLSTPEVCVRAAGVKDIKILAITDHNTAAGALAYWKEPMQHGTLVIPGEEISTDAGHVLAFFVRESIPPGPFEMVLRAIREQDAVAFVAHPFHIPLGNWWRKKSLCSLSTQHLTEVKGIEVFNGHNRAQANALARQLAMDKGLFAISGSDAHFPWEIGNATTEFNLHALTLDALRSALNKGHMKARPRRFNAYGVYLLVGVMNHIRRRYYAWKG